MTFNDSEPYVMALGSMVMMAASLEKVVAEYLVCLAVDAGESAEAERDAYLGESGQMLTKRLRHRGRGELADHLDALFGDRNHLVHGEAWILPGNEGADWKLYSRKKGAAMVQAVWTPAQILGLRDDCAKLAGRLFHQVSRHNNGGMPEAFTLVGSQGPVIPSPRKKFTEASDAAVALV